MQSSLFVSLSGHLEAQETGSACLCGVVDLERRLARRVEVAVVAQSVVLAHNDLIAIRSYPSSFMSQLIIPAHCFQAASQSHTAAHCTS